MKDSSASGSVPAAGGTYSQLERRWKTLCESRALFMREVSCANSGRTLLCVEFGDPLGADVMLAAGVHGDEPAGPMALLEIVESRALDPRLFYRIWPCTNPTGFDARTRENVDGVDVNRTFGGHGGSPEARAILEANRGRTFALSLDLHEDCDAAGFYCYDYGRAEIGRRVIAALEAHGLPIDPLEVTFGLAGPLDDAHCVREPGRVAADAFKEALLLGGLSYSLALARNGARSALTFETPSSIAWETRLAMHRTAVLSAIEAVLEESASTPFN